jgi:hypothetical protein
MNYFIDNNGVVHTRNPLTEETPAPSIEGAYPTAQAEDLFDKYGIAS